MRSSRSTLPPGSEHPIRLFLVEPRALVGVGVREVLEREPDIEIVAEVRSADEAIAMMTDAAPDVVLVDVPNADPEAAEATRRLRMESPDSPMVVIGYEDDAASVVGAMEVGATGHVPVMVEPAELVAMIRRVAGGQDPLKTELITRPDVVERIVDSVRDAIAADRQPVNPLTPRELEVLRLAAAGRRNREIADELEVSIQTVKNHISTLLHKLGVPNRTHAVTYAVRQGWIALDEPESLAAAALRPTGDREH
jgi:DNA-binding NarL/FixJ family response regulator